MSNVPTGDGPWSDRPPLRRPREAETAEHLPSEAIDTPLAAARGDDPDPTADLLAELGLLPSPELLTRYRNTVPDLPNVIVGWIDAQISHRLEQERVAALASESRRTRGQFLSATIATSGLLCAAVVGVFGNPIVASIIAIASIGGPTTAVALARLMPPPTAAARHPDEDGR
jgi:hypothetical protein